MMPTTTKQLPEVRCKLARLDGNPLAILSRWREAARKAGWPSEDIVAVTKNAMSGDYDHLLATISANCKNGGM